MATRDKPVGFPAAPKLRKGLQTVDAETFTRHSRWEEVLLQEPDLALLEASLAHLSGCRIEGGDLGEARLTSLSLDDCELVRTNVANAHAERALVRRVKLDAVRMTGLDLTGAELRDVHAEHCRGDLVSFNGGRLLDVAFEDCVLRDVDFRGARLERVRFDRCDLSLADFSGAEFKRCEMRGCTLERARGVQSLRGVAMPWVDVMAAAGVFAGALGILPLADDGD